MARIVVESGPHKGRVFDLPREGAVDCGRDSGRFLWIPDRKVSRQHFTVAVAPVDVDVNGYVLDDKGSSNGTFVNGKRIQTAALRTGDLIRVGDTFLSFSSDMVDPLVGKTLGGYLVEQRVGRGGMGTVYRAVQMSLERSVALKVLSPALVEEGDFVPRFLTEARTAAKLDHPNIVRIFDVGEADGFYFFSMEYMPGGSLQEFLEKEGALSVERAVRVAIQAAKALVWASERGIVHRDIKPDNLLLAPGDVVKVADFGLAAEERKSKTLYTDGKILGTPSFMAPEQALGRKADHRADIYALGSTLYAALTGAPPFTGNAPVEVLMKKLKEDPVPLHKVVPQVPAHLESVVGQMMAREPEDRYQTAAEVLEALSATLAKCKGVDLQAPRPGVRGIAGALLGKLKGLYGRPPTGFPRPGTSR